MRTTGGRCCGAAARRGAPVGSATIELALVGGEAARR